jgi:hypothetical protein
MNVRVRSVSAVLLCMVASLCTSAAAEAQQRLVVPRLTGPVQLDGRSDEAAWQAVEPLPVVASSPTFGAEPSERTEFRVAHDDEYIWFAARMYDSDPDGIRATSLRRDDGSFTNDWFAVNLDTFLDRETMLVFGVNPAGGRTDAVFPADAQSGPNFTWNTYWDARVARDAEGWYAEIRIPLSSLRFEDRDGVVVMGMTVWRRIARRNEMISWPGIEHRWGSNSMFKASQAAEVELHGIRRTNPVYVTPYALGGGTRVHALVSARDTYELRRTMDREAGLDLKYSPTTNLTLDVTVNTDFAQVEADDQQVNLSRFSLFFPEKRLFFQERGGVFEFGLGGSDQLFYSRQIGLVQGRPVRIYGGLRAIGRLGDWDVGALDMQTAASPTSPSENMGVLRVRRRVLNDNSLAGALLTTRIGDDGSRSFAAGADALVRMAGENYLTLAVAGTGSDSDTVAAADRLFGRVALQRRGLYGALYSAELARVGGGFMPTIGFLGRRDYMRASATAGYGLAMPQTSRLLRQSWGVSGAGYRRNADGTVESAELAAEWYVETRTGHGFTAVGTVRHEDLPAIFRLATGVEVPVGRYTFGTGRIAYSPANTGLLRTSASLEAGSFFDGTRVSLSVSPTWTPSKHFQLSGTWQVNRIDFDDRGQQLHTNVLRVRPLLMVNERLSALAFAQYNSAADAVVINARVRYNPREGNDLYIVYNHGLNTDRAAYDPVRPLLDNQTLLLKYSHTTRF